MLRPFPDLRPQATLGRVYAAGDRRYRGLLIGSSVRRISLLRAGQVKRPTGSASLPSGQVRPGALGAVDGDPGESQAPRHSVLLPMADGPLYRITRKQLVAARTEASRLPATLGSVGSRPLN
jgi:hypothetical protein